MSSTQPVPSIPMMTLTNRRGTLPPNTPSQPTQPVSPTTTLPSTTPPSTALPTTTLPTPTGHNTSPPSSTAAQGCSTPSIAVSSPTNNTAGNPTNAANQAPSHAGPNTLKESTMRRLWDWVPTPWKIVVAILGFVLLVFDLKAHLDPRKEAKDKLQFCIDMESIGRNATNCTSVLDQAAAAGPSFILRRSLQGLLEATSSDRSLALRFLLYVSVLAIPAWFMHGHVLPKLRRGPSFVDGVVLLLLAPCLVFVLGMPYRTVEPFNSAYTSILCIICPMMFFDMWRTSRRALGDRAPDELVEILGAVDRSPIH